MNNPLITIVTVCYNSEKTIKDTIESVLNQTYTNIEYILVDGDSKDNTVGIIKSYEEKAKEKGILYKWISEPDKGIYDAMNKGIDIARGEWINFMNSGDTLIEIPIKELDEEYSFLYGDVLLDGKKRLKYPLHIGAKAFFYGMAVCHQACFYSKKYYKKNKYDLTYAICGDQKFTWKAIEYGKAKYIDRAICTYDSQGISSNNDMKILKEKLFLNKEMKTYLVYPYVSFIRSKLVKIRNRINLFKRI